MMELSFSYPDVNILLNPKNQTKFLDSWKYAEKYSTAQLYDAILVLMNILMLVNYGRIF
jgi:hypothetical protein